jgi:hypothetical protein
MEATSRTGNEAELVSKTKKKQQRLHFFRGKKQITSKQQVV